MPTYSKEELQFWLLSNDTFNSIFKSWKKNNFQKNETPSLDRLDEGKGYSFDNIRIVDWQENNRSYQIKRRRGQAITVQNRPVVQINFNKTKINTFNSISIASKISKVNKSNINQVCLGNRNSAGGYLWKYL